MKPDLNKGQLIKWNDDRGFGFIKPSEGSKEVFLHISAVKTTRRRPKVGDTIFYELTTGTDGRISASGVSIQGVVSHPSTPQKIKTVTSKQKIRKRGLLETALGIGFFAAIVLFQMQFSSNYSPSPITSITKPGCVIKGKRLFENSRNITFSKVKVLKNGGFQLQVLLLVTKNGEYYTFSNRL